MNNTTEQNSEDTAEAGSWAEVKPYTEQVEKIPDISKASDNTLQPCVLYRGRQNWLARFEQQSDPGERGKEIAQELRAIAAKWLKMQNA
jgi:hypothetical protein